MRRTLCLLALAVSALAAYALDPIAEAGEAMDEYFKLFDELPGLHYKYGLNTLGNEWIAGRSSVLLEKDQPSDKYARANLFDGRLDSSWVEGADGDGIGEYVYVAVDTSGAVSYDRLSKDPSLGIEIMLSLRNGYCKNESLFMKNGRVKRARISVFDASIGYDGGPMDAVTVRCGPPEHIYDGEIELVDSMDEQSFNFTVRPRFGDVHGPYSGVILCVLRLEILEVYKGTAYEDTALSELRAPSRLSTMRP